MRPPPRSESDSDPIPSRGDAVPTDRLSFPGRPGHRLAGLLDRPEGEPRAWCLFAHAFGSSKDLRSSRRIGAALVEKGLSVLRFDFTGLGQSEGEFVETGLTTNIEDVLAAADFLRREHRPPSILLGHSLGGAAVLGAAPRIPEAVAVATIATPSDTRLLSATLLRRAPDLLERGEATVDVGGKTVRVRRELLDDLESHDVSRIVGHLGRALLIFHSPSDRTVGIDHAAALFRAARHPKSFVSVDGADHLLLEREEDARFVAGVLAAWAERYLPPAPAGPGPADPRLAPPEGMR